MRRLLIVAAVMVLLAVCAVAHAKVITYEFQGSGSGTLDGVPFTDRIFVITAVGNTDNRETPFAGAFMIPNSSANIAIQSLGSFDFVTSTGVFCNTDAPGIGFTATYDLFTIQNPAAASWDMTTSIGPVYAQAGQLLKWDDPLIHTSGGILIFEDRAGIPCSFEAVVVPEPSALIVLGGGLAGLLGIRRRRP